MQGSQVRCAKCYVNCDILVVFTSVLERYMSTNYMIPTETQVSLSPISL